MITLEIYTWNPHKADWNQQVIKHVRELEYDSRISQVTYTAFNGHVTRYHSENPITIIVRYE